MIAAGADQGAPLVACFAMDEVGHLSSLVPVVSGMVRHGARCVVFSAERHRSRFEAVGAEFVDLFAGRPLAAADDSSRPEPCRYVSFAGHFGTDVIADLELLAPDLIVYDTFAVIGRLVGETTGIPHVCVLAGHDIRPDEYLARLERDPRVRLSPRCTDAVAVLRDRFGLTDATPFFYATALSPDLNLCGEPPEFLDEAHHAAFAPLAFYGCLPDLVSSPTPSSERVERPGDPVHLYASFGTVAPRYFRDEVVEALAAVTAQVTARADLRATLSLSGMAITATERTRLEGDRVTLEGFVDQWDVLDHADLFVTHHGLHSTHEAVFHGVPMLSRPLFWDQPDMARRCQDLGLAVPLGRSDTTVLTASDVGSAVDRAVTAAPTMKEALDRVRSWQVAMMAHRPAVIEQIFALAGRRIGTHGHAGPGE